MDPLDALEADRVGRRRSLTALVSGVVVALASIEIAAGRALLAGSLPWWGFGVVIVLTFGWIVVGARWLVREGRGDNEPQPLPSATTPRS